MQQLTVRKAEDPERWIRGMQRLQARSQELLAGVSGLSRGGAIYPQVNVGVLAVAA